MKEKIKIILATIAIIISIIIMSIWIWDDVIEFQNQDWIDRYDRSYGR